MSKGKKKAVQSPEAPANRAGGLRASLDGQYIGKLAGILLGITAVTALLLGAVNYVTAPVIAAATEEKRVEAMQQVLPAEAYPAVEGFPAEGETFSSAAGSATVTALSQAVQDAPIGYVAEVTANGFGGAIDMVVGVNPEGMVTGVSIINDAETPNVGSKVVGDQTVLDQFIGLGGEITVNGGDNGFDVVSGAAVSTNAVAAGVNAAIAAVEARMPVLESAEEG